MICIYISGIKLVSQFERTMSLTCPDWRRDLQGSNMEPLGSKTALYTIKLPCCSAVWLQTQSSNDGNAGRHQDTFDDASDAIAFLVCLLCFCSNCQSLFHMRDDGKLPRGNARSTARYIWSLFRHRRAAENNSNSYKRSQMVSFCEAAMTRTCVFMDQRQLTVYNNSNNQMKTEKSPVRELIFVPLSHKKSH